ncbi:N-acetylmuramoyl-L-alanine amidase [Friedmanniella luteola]|uniref:N-acetylmuramoyl-L-alanine amidase n=1 Tax=Friedmanniella luteola TaxID=546871 RepID=A0A1H1ZMZ6_9ACTN|nr:N-acetylmuramoyl-L-alanine amidase [Friedmanniella luteola]SDT35185.1 N-acetylmuramoyl-L-alanine amidase [Friedmanniella luteola]
MSPARRLLAAAASLLAAAAPVLVPAGSPAAAAPAVAASRPLAGKVVLIDPGHQLGNATHLRQINRPVDAGGLRKPCNSVGAATSGHYPESTFTLAVAEHLRRRLVAQGATVRLTRTTDSKRAWGPCVDVRGRMAGKVDADVLVSLHADSAPARFHGFFIIRPAYRKGITDDIHRDSRTLSSHVRAGLGRAGVPRANYYGGDGYDTRDDMGTLNLSAAPAVMVELGNMLNATDAQHMRSDRFCDDVYAAGLARGVAGYLRR